MRKPLLPICPEFAYVNIAEISAIYNIPKITLRRWVVEGRFLQPVQLVRDTNRMHWKFKDVQEWFDNRPIINNTTHRCGAREAA